MSTVKRKSGNTSKVAKSVKPKTETSHRNNNNSNSSSRTGTNEKLRNITNTIRMSTGDEPPAEGPPVKRNKPSDQSYSDHSSSASTSSQSELVPFEKLLFVLGRNYFDVCQRLALDYVPPCVRNITVCAQNHASKRNPRTRCVSFLRQETTHHVLLEHQPDLFLELLNQALMRHQFIDADLFVAGLQLMLTFNLPTEELEVEYGVEDIVYGTGETLETFLERFPPCRWDLRSTYQRVLLGQLNAPCFQRCDQREGLFRNVLHLIELNIEKEQETDEPEGGGRRAGRGNEKRTARRNPSEDDEMQYNYNAWSLANRKSYDFDRLSREERFPRLFAVLQVLVRLLEMDFAMWILRNPTKTQQNLCNPSRNPLLAWLVWNGDYGSVNIFVKKLFQIFINMCGLQYPAEDIAIVSRLLNLVMVAVNLSEFQHNDGHIDYPCAKDNCHHFARQLWKTLETSAYFNIPACLRTIRSLRSPFLRHRLVEHLLQKMDRGVVLSNVRHIFQQLHERRWLECSEAVRDEEGSPSVTYPVLNAQRTRASEISQKQYVELLLVGLRAYCDIYQLPAYFREIMVRPGSESGGGEPMAGQQPDAVDERMIFRGIAMSAEQLLEYRNDIKYLLLIEQQLKKIESEEERALFRDWFAFLAQVDPSLTV